MSQRIMLEMEHARELARHAQSWVGFPAPSITPALSELKAGELEVQSYGLCLIITVMSQKKEEEEKERGQKGKRGGKLDGERAQSL